MFYLLFLYFAETLDLYYIILLVFWNDLQATSVWVDFILDLYLREMLLYQEVETRVSISSKTQVPWWPVQRLHVDGTSLTGSVYAVLKSDLKLIFVAQASTESALFLTVRITTAQVSVNLTFWNPVQATSQWFWSGFGFVFLKIPGCIKWDFCRAPADRSHLNMSFEQPNKKYLFEQ